MTDTIETPAAVTTYNHFIAGQWSPSTSGATFESRNPADTRDVHRAVPAGDRRRCRDGDQGSRSRRADGGGGSRPPKRGEILYRFGALMAENKERLSRAMIALPESIDVRPASADRARRPRPDLPRDPLQLAAAGGRRDRRPGRLAPSVLLLTKGLIAAAGPAARRVRRRTGAGAGDRLPRRARRTRARPSPARRRWSSAPPTPTCATSSARSSTAPAWSASAPATSPGSRWRARPRTPPRSPPPPPSRTGSTPPGSPSPQIWRECIEYALARGAELETFSGLAGVGDLTATMMAPTGRNRRAGELLGDRHPGGGDPGKIGQASEGLDTVPLLAEAVAAAGGRGRGAGRPGGADPRRDRRRGLGRRAAPGRAMRRTGRLMAED